MTNVSSAASGQFQLADPLSSFPDRKTPQKRGDDKTNGEHGSKTQVTPGGGEPKFSKFSPTEDAPKSKTTLLQEKTGPQGAPGQADDAKEHRADIKVDNLGRLPSLQNKASYTQPTKPGWTAQDNARGERNARNGGISPKNLISDIATRYNPGAVLVAHRGLVDLANGIPENSLEAIDNAVKHGINTVEIDVQATGDGVAVPLHDNALDRPFEGDKRYLKDVTINDLLGNFISIKEPPGPDGTSNYQPTDSEFHSLQYMMETKLKQYPGLSIILDPKNLGAAQAAAKVLAKNPWMLSRVAMKTYAPFWRLEPQARGKTPSDALAEAFRSAAPPGIATSMMKLAPVVNPGTEVYNTPESLSYINRELTDWGRNFEIPQVEIPGYWKPGWHEQKSALFKQWAQEDQDDRSIFKFNWDANSGGNVIMSPNIGTGYRFEDFEKDGKFYDWDMNGQAVLDKVQNPTRRTAGSEAGADGWLTTDVPLQEANTLIDGDVFGVGNANVDF